jgi:hypothetical protein
MIAVLLNSDSLKMFIAAINILALPTVIYASYSNRKDIKLLCISIQLTTPYYNKNGEYIGIHQGQFAEGKRNGQGTLTHPDGTTQSGLWKDDYFMD